MTEVEHIAQLLSEDEILHPLSPGYDENSRTRSAKADLKPKLIVRPRSIETLSRVIAYLAKKTELDFAIRCGGCGSVSAKDVLVSMAAFEGFEFDETAKTVVVGAGQTWGEVDLKMEKLAPGYAVVGARQSYVGVGGSTLTGGISWLSSEFGLACDPQNMLDAQIVMLDGKVIWASEEPGLLWALRGGGGGGFGVVTAFKFQAHPYPLKVFGGMIIYPQSSLSAVAKAMEAFASASKDCKMAMNLHYLNMPQGACLAAFVYDANGEVHGRSSDGFGWAFAIEGARDMTKSLTISEVNQIGSELSNVMGKENCYISAVTFPKITAELICRCWDWFAALVTDEPRSGVVPLLWIGMMQLTAFGSVNSSEETAWPHTSNQHMLQVGISCFPGSPKIDERVLRLLHETPSQIIGDGNRPISYLPSFILPFNDPALIYGGNYAKLVDLKRRYDPEGRLRGVFAPQKT